MAYWGVAGAKKGIFNPVTFAKTARYLPRYLAEFNAFKRDAGEKGEPLRIKNTYPVFVDYSAPTVNRHYWFQDIHVATQVIDMAKGNPDHLHIDIGSRIEGFITSLISARVKLIFGEINLPKISFPNTQTTFIDLQKMTPDQLVGANSVSCLHVIEHLGLGKYGDAIDSQGHLKVIEDFHRVMPAGVPLFISFPTSSEPGITFNAGRDLDPIQMLDKVRSVGFSIDDVAFVTSDWKLEIDPSIDLLKSERYGCLILRLVKEGNA